MKRRQFLKHACFASTVLSLQAPLLALAGSRSHRLLETAPFVNSSDLTTLGMLPGHSSGPHFDGTYIGKLRAGRVTVVSASMVFWLYDEFHETTARINDFNNTIDRYSNDLRMVWNYSDINTAEKEGKIALLMHAHTPSILGGDLKRLEILHKSGLRVLGFSHQQSSLLAEGAGEDLEEGDGGLSRFGAAVLRELNRLHIIADLGHASDESILQAARISSDPIIVSHTCVRALAGHKEQSLLNRNISDDAIRAIAENKGVIGIMALTPHLTADRSKSKPSMGIYLDHIEHVIHIAGIDHVGIGTETGYGASAAEMKHLMADITSRLGNNTPVIDTFNAVANLEPGVGLVVPGMEDMSRVKLNLIEEMIGRGYSDEAIEKILGLNFLRVYKQVLLT